MNVTLPVNKLADLIVNDPTLYAAMDAYARNQLTLSGEFTPEQISTATNEEREDELVYARYWSETGSFFRKLLTATAAIM